MAEPGFRAFIGRCRPYRGGSGKGCVVSKSTVDEIIGKLKAYARESAAAPPKRAHLGFANEREADVFRAAASTHPAPVLITKAMPKVWKTAAEELVKLRTFGSVIVTGGTAYKLTSSGKRKAIEEGLIDAE